MYFYIKSLFNGVFGLAEQSIKKIATTPILLLALVVGLLFQALDIELKVN